MSILGGLMQAGGYALQAKPKTYDAYGLAAAKAAGDAGKRKSKEQEDLQKQFKSIIMTTGGNILEWQKDRFMDNLSSSLAEATRYMESGNRQAATETMTRAMLDAKTYANNHKSLTGMLGAADNSAINPRIYAKLFQTSSPEEAKDMFETYGQYLGMQYDDKSGAVAFEKYKKVNKESVINASMQGMLTELTTQSLDGRKVLTKQAAEATRRRVTDNIKNMPGVRAEYLSRAIDELENSKVDIKGFPPESVIQKAEQMMEAEIYPLTGKELNSILGQGQIINLYNLPPETQKIFEGGSGTLQMPTGDIPYNMSINLGDQQFTVGPENMILDESGITIQRPKGMTVQAGTTYPVFAFNKKITSDDAGRILSEYNKLSESERQQIRQLETAILGKDINKISTAILNENQARVINKILPNSVSAGLATTITYKTGEGKSETKESGFMINNTKQQIEAWKTNAKKAPQYNEFVKNLDAELERMNNAIGVKKQAPPSNAGAKDAKPKEEKAAKLSYPQWKQKNPAGTPSQYKKYLGN
jgi:hypothetical protein